MIKRILVALDPDSDTPIATRYATQIAKRYGAEVTGLAVIDLEGIQAGTRGGGIGSMYYAEKLRERLTDETREKARQLTETFDAVMEDSGVPHAMRVREGVPVHRIVEDAKYHDLVIVGDDPHFFYGHPEKRTDTLAHVVKQVVTPTLVVESQYEPVHRVLITYDGSDASARTLQRFANLQAFGTELQVEVLHLYDKDANESELLLGLARDYLGAHGFDARVVSQQGSNVADAIVNHAQTSGADLVVAGAHSVSKLKKLAFGSTTAALIESCPVNLFLHH